MTQYHDDFYDPMQRYPRRRRRGGGAWVIVSMVFIAFIVGALVMAALGYGLEDRQQGLLPQQSAPPATSWQQTPAPTATPRPAVVPPELGGKQGWILSSDELVADISDQVGQTVVGVIKNRTVTYRNRGEVEEPTSSGSGVILSEDGYIITNQHVIADASSVVVILPGGGEYRATVVGADERSDLAMLKIDAQGLSPALLGDSEAVRAGQIAIAVGNPLGQELAGTVTVGVVSAVNRNIAVDSSGRTMNMLQTDAAINPGNSGGALVNSRGELIGIITMKSISAGFDEYGNNIAAEGIGFCIPTNDAMDIAKQLISVGYVSRPWIGIANFREIDQETAKQNQLPQGLWVRVVYPDTPAERAGFLPDDIIVAADGQPIHTFAQLTSWIDTKKVGDTINLTVYRDAVQGEVELSIVLAEYNEYDHSQTEQPEPSPSQGQEGEPESLFPWWWGGEDRP